MMGVMIVRSWGARCSPPNAERYAAYFRTEVLPHLNSLDGFHDAILMTRNDGQCVDIRALTMWESLDKVQAFAGADITVANVAPKARALLTTYDTTVTHFEVQPLATP
jgi:heme-degrading monooxygenase HmoA